MIFVSIHIYVMRRNKFQMASKFNVDYWDKTVYKII